MAAFKPNPYNPGKMKCLTCFAEFSKTSGMMTSGTTCQAAKSPQEFEGCCGRADYQVRYLGQEPLVQAKNSIQDEYDRAVEKYEPNTSPFHNLAILDCHLRDALFSLRQHSFDNAQLSIVKVAVMALRYLVDAKEVPIKKDFVPTHDDGFNPTD